MEEAILSHAIRDTHFRIRHFLREQGGMGLQPDLTWVEVLVLSTIFDHQDKMITAKDIASETKLSKASVSQTLGLLIAKNMIEVKVYRKDRRAKEIIIKEMGKSWISNFREAFDEFALSIEQGIPKEEKEITLKTLQKLRENCLLLTKEHSKGGKE